MVNSFPSPAPSKSAAAPAKEAPSGVKVVGDGKILVAYFSCTGNTKALAENAAKALNADLYRIEPAQPYTEKDLDYHDKHSRSSVEMNDPKSRPAIGNKVDNMGKYETLVIAYPIWWGVPPMCVFTFFEKHDWTGKTVKPFATHEGSGLGGSVRAIKKALPAATVADGLAIQGQTAQNDRPAAKKAVDKWLAGLGF